MGQFRTPDGAIRRLGQADIGEFRSHLLRLDEDARRDRFGLGSTPAFAERYAGNALALGTDLIGWFEAGALRGVAELRPLGGREAEATFTVEPECRRRGIGTALFRALIDAARERRIRRLYMSCLARNRAMQELARRFEADLIFEAADVVGIVGRHGDPAWATAILDIDTRWFGVLPRRP